MVAGMGFIRDAGPSPARALALGAAYGVAYAKASAEPVVQPHPTEKQKHPHKGMFSFLVAGMGFEPHDLQVMSLASYRTALPRDKVMSIIPSFLLIVKSCFVFFCRLGYKNR